MNDERVAKEVFTSDVQAGVIRAIFAARPKGEKQQFGGNMKEHSRETAGDATTAEGSRVELKRGS